MSQLLQRKPISSPVRANDEEHSLRRVLGASDLVMLAIGAVIGAGIFSSIGTAAAGEVLPSGEVVRYGAGPAFHTMMTSMASLPPFETFYAEHAGDVLRLLRRRLGRQRADDAFQETFLRALRAYDRLSHGEHLRAWVLTIATRVAIDAHRRAGDPTDELPDLPHLDGRPAYEELAFLTDTLPPKERAAVVLRYGYDLDYDQIAAALDSSEEAARQAASSGVRRLRRRIT